MANLSLLQQDIEKKIEETKQKFKNEYVQGKCLLTVQLASNKITFDTTPHNLATVTADIIR